MRKLLIFLSIIIIAWGCNNEEIPVEEEVDPCSLLIDGVYVCASSIPDSSLTSEERKEYMNIPESVLPCLTTEGLIKSCYTTFYGRLIEASNGYQSGYNLMKNWCRGFDELEKRLDAPAAFISYFKTIELKNTIDYNLYALEVASAQDSVLNRFSKEQKIEMLNLQLDYFEERRNIFNDSVIHWDGTPVFMGRLMAFDENEPFLFSIDRNDALGRFIDGTGTYQLSIELADTIIYYTENYLIELNVNPK
ncbi:hypothetical protein [Maribellus maritimus]|uniref:hypothetical protein n=1 Tax=Maribellus maritimus TaxID=2870838 RepID=UPI001EEC4300|nr:hypothetical protein [Maribellus maritimus]MCG6187623.1 hypothetical protein [Maribellus maritimus]